MNNKIDFIRLTIIKQNANIEDLTLRTLNTLRELDKLNSSYFNKWFEQGSSLKNALEKRIFFEKDDIKSIIEKEWDKKVPQLGSHFALWTGKANEAENFILSFNIGIISSNKNINNSICLSFPYDYKMSFNKEFINEIIKIFKNNWTVLEIDKIYQVTPSPDAQSL